MKILGIDPGTAETGYGIIKSQSYNSKLKTRDTSDGDRLKQSESHNSSEVESLKLVTYGCIKTSVNDEMPKRLVILRDELKKIIETHKPACMVIEQLFFGQNSKTAMAVGQAKGVVMFCAGESGIPVYEYQGLSVKLGLSGNGRAKKGEIQSCVRKILGLRSLPRPDHAADALGVAIHHARKNILKTT